MITLLSKPVFKKAEEEEEVEFNYNLIVCLVLSAIQIVKFLGLCCCHSCVSFGVNFIWIGIELLIVLILGVSSVTLETAIAAPMVSISLSYFVISFQLMRQHLDLMAHHLTEKEFSARMKTCSKL